ncbi:MAG: hypothetical protein K9K32_01440 [Halanaerobiales bacterium]|nr:hypothetical protein [Halanaerobiales bacterium]
MKKIISIFIICLFLLIPTQGLTKELNFNISKTYGTIGEYFLDNTNTVADNHIKLPTDTSLFNINYNKYVFKDWADYYSVTFGSNIISSGVKPYQDNYFNNSTDNKVARLKGESSFNTFYIDILLANYLLEYSTPKDNYLVLIGYQYDNLKYSSKDGNHYDYSTDTTTNITNKISDFNKSNHIPYLGFMYNRNLTKFNLKNELTFKVSPYLYSTSHEDNYYNDYIITSTNKGYSLSIDNRLHYIVNTDFYLSGGFKYKKLNGSGSGEKSFYEGPYSGNSYHLDTSLDSNQYEFNLGLMYRF